MELTIFLLIFAFVVALMMGGYGLLFRQSDGAARRLSEWELSELNLQPAKSGWNLLRLAGQLTSPLQKLFPLSSEKKKRLQKKLVYAGYFSPQALGVYRATQFVALLTPPLFVWVFWLGGGWAASDSLPWLMLALFIGYVTPRQLLDNQVKARQQRLRWGLADAMDLLVISLEAGLDLNAALVRVSQELQRVHPDICYELARVNWEIQVGQEREIAFRNLAERTGVDDLRSFCATLIQAERFGSSIVRAVRVYSESLRVKRRQRAEQTAQKAAVKLLIPLALFMFPTLFIIILGPAFIQIMRNFVTP